MGNEEKISEWLAGRRWGVEIGAFKTPLPGLNPFYVDCFEEYAGERCLLDFKGDACHLPFVDNSLDYIASSHVLEHVANPVRALAEWARVLRVGGLIYAVIPDKRYTWDRRRSTVTLDHLASDFVQKVTQVDGTHVDEFIDGIVWEEYAPQKSEAERESYRHILTESVKAGLEINIHFHAFEPKNFADTIQGLNVSRLLPYRFELLDLVERFPDSTPNGFLAVLRVHKADMADWMSGALNRVRHRLFPAEIVRHGTRRYPRGDIPAAAPATK